MDAQTEAVLKALDFIEAHLRDPITVGDMAGAAGYSTFHFVRTFNQIVRQTPHAYLIRRRLSEAGRALRDSEARVIDIALGWQFASHEGFTRAFGRFFGRPPSAWREGTSLSPRRFLPRLGRTYLAFLNRPKFRPPEMVRLAEMRLAGWMETFCAAPDPAQTQFLQEAFKAALAGTPLPAGDRHGEGVWFFRAYPDGEPEMGALFVGLPVSGPAPLLYGTRIVPGGLYLRMGCCDLARDWDAACVFMHHSFLPKSGLEIRGSYELAWDGGQSAILLPVSPAGV